jgi:phage-related holin
MFSFVAPTIQSRLQSFIVKNNMKKKNIFITILVLVAFLFDCILGTGRVPTLTILVCAIVVVYECISPYLYSSR